LNTGPVAWRLYLYWTQAMARVQRGGGRDMTQPPASTRRRLPGIVAHAQRALQRGIARSRDHQEAGLLERPS